MWGLETRLYYRQHVLYSHMMNAHIAESAHTGNLAIVTKPFSLKEGVRSGDETRCVMSTSHILTALAIADCPTVPILSGQYRFKGLCPESRLYLSRDNECPAIGVLEYIYMHDGSNY